VALRGRVFEIRIIFDKIASKFGWGQTDQKRLGSGPIN
jgi:hypothetical protein